MHFLAYTESRIGLLGSLRDPALHRLDDVRLVESSLDESRIA